MKEINPKSIEHNPEIDKVFYMYPFQDHSYDNDPEVPLDSVSGIINAIGIGWISLYGVLKQEDGDYTIAFADENNDKCYKKRGFTESEVLEVFNTEYKGKC